MRMAFIRMTTKEQIGLTPRQTEIVLRLDLSNHEIAEDLGISWHLVCKELQIILEKFDARNRTAVALEAVRLGIIKIPVFDKSG